MRRHERRLILFWMCLLATHQSNAQAASYRGSLAWTTLGIYTSPTKSDLNPDNMALEVPQVEFLSEWRPNVNVSLFTNKLRLTVNPRLQVFVDKMRVSDSWQAEKVSYHAFWSEAYATAAFGSSAQFSYGVQNFEWGPAELLSPSNHIFKEIGLLKGLYFESHGKYLARLNLTQGKNFSSVFILQTDKNESYESVLPKLQPSEPFEHQAVAKFEYSDSSGEDALGLLAGGGEETKPYVGAYFLLRFSSGLSLYYDGSVGRKGSVYYPTKHDDGSENFEIGKKSDIAYVQVPGVRFEFENGIDIRLESYFNTAGYTRDQIESSYRIASTPSALSAVNLAIAESPGLTFLGKNMLYASLRIPDFGYKNKMMFSLRHLQSFSDFSSQTVGFFDVPLTDAWETFVTALYAKGDNNNELSRTIKWQTMLGSRYSW